MGRIVSKSGQINKSNSLVSCALERQQDAYNTITVLEAFVNDTELSGKSYCNSKGYVRHVLIPFYKALCMALVDEISVNKEVILCCETHLAGVDRLVENDLLEEIENLNKNINHLEESLLNCFPSIRKIHNDRIDEYKVQIEHLSKELEKIDSFDSATQELHNSISDQIKRLVQNLESTASAISFANGSFGYRDINMSWADSYIVRWQESKFPEEMEKYNLLRDCFEKEMINQYGFDERTAKLIFQTYNMICLRFQEKSQEEKNFIFSRLISQFSYNEGESIEKMGITINSYKDRWRKGAGYIVGYTEEDEFKYFVNTLGFSEDNYHYLRFHVRLQNQLAASTLGDRETVEADRRIFLDKQNEWNKAIELFEKGRGEKDIDKEKYLEYYGNYFESFHGKADFAHMMYTIAGNIADENTLGLASEYKVGFRKLWDTHEERKEYIGWLGDATWTGANKEGTAFGRDDILADLDSANISQRLNKQSSLSIVSALDNYYSQINDSPKSRTAEFLGSFKNGYEDVESKILTKTGIKEYEKLMSNKKYADTIIFLQYLKEGEK